jgi:hypothetical protein
MVTARRRKQRAKKDLAKAARQAKKQRNQEVRVLDAANGKKDAVRASAV